jgi:hypothetical protein
MAAVTSAPAAPRWLAAARGASSTTRHGAVSIVEGLDKGIFSMALSVLYLSFMYLASLLEYKVFGAQDKLCPLLVDGQVEDTNCQFRGLDL